VGGEPAGREAHRLRPQQAELGRVYATYKAYDKTDAKTGNVIPQYLLRGPTSSQFRPAHEFGAYDGNFEKLEEAAAKKLWDEEYEEAPDHVDSEEHFLTGAFLPIWDRIPGDKPKIYRLRTADGQTVVGRHVPQKHVQTLMKNLGVTATRGAHTPADVHAKLAAGAGKVTLANGWKLRPVRVQGERRIELTGPSAYQMNELMQDGVTKERINYDTRFFVPAGADGVKVLERVTKSRPVTDVEALKLSLEASPDRAAAFLATVSGRGARVQAFLATANRGR
jgi:hypothetical protein